MRWFAAALALAIGLSASSTAIAMTWTVLPDGGGDAPTIQAGIDSASAGDTVLVGCGTYYEHGIFPKSGVVLISETGNADCVTIDTEHIEGGFECCDLGSTTVIQGFTVIHGSKGFDAGGIYVCNSDLHLINCRFDSCQASQYGGGMKCTSSSVTLINCGFKGNDALQGGGIHSETSSLVLVGCDFSGNNADAGGGLRSILGEVSLDSCTFCGNAATHGSGIESWGDSLSIDRTIIAFGVVGAAIGYITDPILTCCDLYGNSGGDWVGSIASQYGINGNISADPLFCDADVGDLHLDGQSPCRFTAECGQIGAFGKGCNPPGPWWYVSTGGSDITGDGSVGNPFATIQKGIDCAVPGESVMVECGTYYEHDILMKSGIHLRSVTGDAECVTIDADSLGTVVSCSGVDASTTIEGFTLKGGSGSSGGGMSCSNSDLVVRNSVFVGNSGTFGGGIFCSYSDPSLEGCTFSDNSGPAVLYSFYSSPTLERTIMSFNPSGEAISCLVPEWAPTLTCCDIYGNAGGDWTGFIAPQYGVSGNISADPLFCDRGRGNLLLNRESPCADASGCGQIGALGIGCAAEPGAIYVSTSGNDLTGDGTQGNPFASIHKGIDSAFPGDTVLVEFGTYYEHDITMKSGICLRSMNGDPEYVTVDADSLGRVMLCAGVDSTTCIEGITLTGGVSDGGGGMYCHHSDPRISDCVFAHSSAYAGGGLRLYSSDPIIQGCVFYGNSANFGGAMDCQASSPVLRNCTLSGNSYGGVYCFDNSFPQFENTIITFNTFGNAMYCEPGDCVPSLSCCDLFGNSGGDWVGCIAGMDSVNGNFSADPLFCSRETGDYHLHSCSPCLNAPGCGLVGALGAGGCHRVWHVPGDAASIQAGIDSTCSGDTVLVAPGTYYESISPKAGIYVIGEAGDPEVTIIDGSGVAAPVLFILTETSYLEGFTLRNGFANYGGGVVCNTASAEVTNCRIVDNHVNLQGGAILCEQSASAVFTDCIIAGNTSGDVGGVLASYSSSNTTFTNCTLYGNGAPTGGGIYAFHGSVTLENSIIAFGTLGAAAHCIIGTISLSCCDVYGNAGGDWTGCIAGQAGINGNLSANPLFCDADSGDFRIDSASPCAPENSPTGCGLIGALGSGCDVASIQESEPDIPSVLSLGPAAPNPFSRLTEIAYGIPAASGPVRVKLCIYDALGRRVAAIVDDKHPPGRYRVSWNGQDQRGQPVSGGVYFYRLTWNGESRTRKVVLVR